jgi:AcrR family transcriptional regulator
VTCPKHWPTRRPSWPATAARRRSCSGRLRARWACLQPRRTGISPVKRRAFGALAEALADGLARGEPLADPEAEGVRRFRNLGLAYVGFARANPGLFHTAFYTPDNAALERPGVIEARIEATRAYQILTQALDELVAVGLLDESRRDVAPIALWAAVHGLATLFVDGPLAGLESPEQDAAVERTIDILMDGIRTHRA